MPSETFRSSITSADGVLHYPVEPDLLGRVPFARSIARAILGWNGRESLVIALYGRWGEGKSSVIGMVRHYLHRDGMPIPIQISFNPWEWAGRNQLAKVFFDEIGLELHRHGIKRNSQPEQEVANDLRELGRILHNAAEIGEPLSRIAGMFLPPLGAAGVALSDLARAGSRLLNPSAADKSPDRRSLHEVKESLKDHLKGLKSPIVIFIDDIDRLVADEILLLFQLIKANSDFPKLVFFLAFQRDVIEKALEDTVRTGAGAEFLEKFVQVPLILPVAQPHHIQNALIVELDRLLADLGMMDWLNRPRLNEALPHLMEYLGSLRNIKRLINTYSFHLGLFDREHREVDPVDLLILEVLRLFEPSAHAALIVPPRLPDPNELILFDEATEDKTQEQEWQSKYEPIIRLAPENRRMATLGLLRILIPVETLHPGGWLAELGRKLQEEARFSHPSFKGRYLHLCIPDRDVPQSIIDRLRNNLGNPRTFREEVNRLIAIGTAAEAIDRLLVYASDTSIPDAAFPKCFESLVHWDDATVRQTSLEPPLTNLVEALLRRFRSQPNVVQNLAQQIETAPGLSVANSLWDRLVSRTLDYERDHEPYEGQSGMTRDRAGVLERQQIERLKLAWLKLVERQSQSAEFLRLPILRGVLEDWQQQAGKDRSALDTWLEANSNTPWGLTLILKPFLGNFLEQRRSHSADRRNQANAINCLRLVFGPVSLQRSCEQALAKTTDSESVQIFTLCRDLLTSVPPIPSSHPPKDG